MDVFRDDTDVLTGTISRSVFTFVVLEFADGKVDLRIFFLSSYPQSEDSSPEDSEGFRFMVDFIGREEGCSLSLILSLG